MKALVTSLATAAAAIDRRRMLFGLAAASTAMATAPAAAALATIAVPDEDPELIRLGALTAGICDEAAAAETARDAVIAEWGPQWPPLPEILCGPSYPATYFTGGYAGNAWSAEDLEATLARLNLRPTQKARRKWYRVRIEAARAYEAECRRVREGSGFAAADERWGAAVEAILDHMFAALNIEAVTMKGVLIQAAIVDAGRHARLLDHLSRELKERWRPGEELARAILRVAGGEVAGSA